MRRRNKPYEAAARLRGEIGVLHGFRVLLLFMVAQFHFWQQSWLTKSVTLFGVTLGGYTFHNTGYLFVDGFLLLSGFLLYLPYARAEAAHAAEPSLQAFYFRRARRILPSYVFAVLGSLLMAMLPRVCYASLGELLADVAAHLTFTQLFFEKTYYGSPINGGLWTVVVEVQWYALFPLAVMAMRRHKVLTLSAMTLTGWLFRWYAAAFTNGSAMLINQLPAFLDVLALGMMTAMLVARLEQKGDTENKLLRASIGCAAMGGVAIGLALLTGIASYQAKMARISYDALHIGQLQVRLPLALTLVLLMLCCMALPKALKKLLDNRLMRFLSALSMNFYFWHQVLAVHLRQVLYPDTNALYAQPLQQSAYELLSWCVALLFAMAVTYGIEKPAAKRLTAMYQKRERRMACKAE